MRIRLLPPVVVNCVAAGEVIKWVAAVKQLVAVRRGGLPTEPEGRFWRRAVDALREARWLTRERVMRWGVGFAVLAATVLGMHIATHTTAGLSDGKGGELANDFINFWSGAQFAAAGHASSVYDIGRFQAFEQALTGPSSSFRIYAYPPIAMLLSLPLALLPFVPGLIAWTILGATLCFALLRVQIGWRSAAIVTVGAPAALLNILSGQNGYFTSALLAGGLTILDRRPVLAGICFGSLAYKPQFGLLLPLALIAGRQRRALAAAALTVIVLTGISVAFFGVQAWAAFFDVMPVQRHLTEFGSNYWHRVLTVFIAARLIGAPVALAYAAQLIACSAAAAVVVVVWRSPMPLRIKAASLVIATFLATPYAWDYDAVVLVFAAAWLAREGLRTGFLPWERIAIVALLTVPLFTMATAKLARLQFCPIVLSLVLAVVVRQNLARTRVVTAGETAGA